MWKEFHTPNSKQSAPNCPNCKRRNEDTTWDAQAICPNWEEEKYHQEDTQGSDAVWTCNEKYTSHPFFESKKYLKNTWMLLIMGI